MALSLNLPALNDGLQVGINFDPPNGGSKLIPTLADEQKLRIYTACRNSVDASYMSALWAYRNYQGSYTKEYATAAYVIVGLGWVGKVDGARDGDWVPEEGLLSMTDVEKEFLQKNITPSLISTMTTVVVAAKGNWWRYNHHTELGGPKAYLLEVLRHKFGEKIFGAVTKMAHIIGHWASTIAVLRSAGILKMRTFTALFEDRKEAYKLHLSDDAKTQFRSLPAGYEKLVVAYEAAKYLFLSEARFLCPGIENFLKIKAWMDCVKPQLNLNDIVEWHECALYLCGKYTKNTYFNLESMLGRLGTFVNKCMSKSPIASSPHFQKVNVMFYEDFSDLFWNDLRAFQKASLESHQKKTDLLESYQVNNKRHVDEITKKFFM